MKIKNVWTPRIKISSKWLVTEKNNFLLLLLHDYKCEYFKLEKNKLYWEENNSIVKYFHIIEGC